MKKTKLALAMSLAFAIYNPAQAQEDHDHFKDHGHFKHTLLISIDGLHALDVANYVSRHPNSTLAELSRHGVTYTNARTPALSDSFPGLLALVTGGSPVSHGVFYDVSYNRNIYDPSNTTCKGQPGNMQVYDESIDMYDSKTVSLDKIDPNTLPRFIDDNGKCSPKYPHNALQTNTIFEVVKENGVTTAWADKHPAYDLVNGPSGIGVDDLYTPEITNNNGFDNTVSVVCTSQNDDLKVNAILNQIKGLTHDGKPGTGVPTLFGMNFQAVSVGQKLASDNKDGSCKADTTFIGQKGGYLDGSGTPSDILTYGLDTTDKSLGKIIHGLKSAHIYDSTLVIITAKHGQSPINPILVNKPGHFADLVAALPDASSEPGKIIAEIASCSSGNCGFVQDDDIVLIWLPDQSKTQLVADYLNTNAKALFIEEVMAGNNLKLKFNNPTKDDSTPDIIVQPVYGTIYTGSSKKNAEHGGFSSTDTNVGLIVSNPSIEHLVVKTPVATSQVAATIVESLRISSKKLGAVRKEGTKPLPFLFD
jgi:hypothetical protein